DNFTVGRTSNDMHASSDVPFKFFTLPTGQKVNESAFEKATAYFHKTERPPICPFGQERKVQVGMEQWKKWWLFLRYIRHRHPVTEDTLHLLSLGSLHPGSHVGRWRDPRFINNVGNTSCKTHLASSLSGTPPILRRSGLPSCNEGHERHHHPESGLCALCLEASAVSSFQRGPAGGNHGSRHWSAHKTKGVLAGMPAGKEQLAGSSPGGESRTVRLSTDVREVIHFILPFTF
ncbi:hypothetical protein BCR37DRAFT_384662, partial [Protomyces lactucae-debilis]